jgi:hypothetical protein
MRHNATTEMERRQEERQHADRETKHRQRDKTQIERQNTERETKHR